MLYRFRSIYQFCLTKIVKPQDQRPSKFDLRNFIDSARLVVKAGNGGNGCITFYTDKRVRKGEADGGEGGKGGDIIIESHDSLHDLSHLRRKAINGNDGGNGGAQGKNGKDGGKTIIRVPNGTLLYEIKNEDNIEKKTFLADLGKINSKIIIAKGGQRGHGNKIVPFLQNNQRYGAGGETKIIELQLKCLADIGLVGLPNIGKSTFLASVTRALPKIADYAFTTLKPSIGYVKFVDDFTMTIADIPGIIQDAHLNKGLGFQFLKHIERTKVLVFIVDVTSKDPLYDYQLLQNELNEYNKAIFINKQRIIAFNKGDKLTSFDRFYSIEKQLKYKSFLISAKQGMNVGNVILEARKMIEKIRRQDQKNEQELNKITNGQFL